MDHFIYGCVNIKIKAKIMDIKKVKNMSAEDNKIKHWKNYELKNT